MDLCRGTLKSPRGLTLVEVLVSLVLLTLIVASTAPLLREATQAAAEPPAVPVPIELQDAVDQFVDDPARFGWETVDTAGQFSFPEGLSLEPIQVKILHTSSGTMDYQWVQFQWNGQSTLRWIPRTSDEDAAEGNS